LCGERWGKRGWGLCGGDALYINVRSSLLRLALFRYGAVFKKVFKNNNL
jgi:hypothetical protein